MTSPKSNWPITYWLYMVTLSIIGMALATYFSERKQAEGTLRKLSLAVEKSSSSVVITGLDTSIECVN